MPRTVTIIKQAFTFDELNDKAKAAARDWWREGMRMDSTWYESTFEDAAQCAAILGIQIDENDKTGAPVIYFSGFWSQGDGACFEGNYINAPDAPKLIRQHAPQDATLHKIADDLAAVQAKHGGRLFARMSHAGRYSHSGSMSVDAPEWLEDAEADAELLRLMRAFADWIYSQLEKEWDYQNADAQADDAIRANEYEFTADGKRFTE